jgi:hypothetical protein
MVLVGDDRADRLRSIAEPRLSENHREAGRPYLSGVPEQGSGAK